MLARSPAGIIAWFAGDGVRVRARRGDLALRLAGIGRPQRMEAVAKAEPAADGAKVRYARYWYQRPSVWRICLTCRHRSMPD